jgi:uncharacterized protein (TIGR02246 family)
MRKQPSETFIEKQSMVGIKVGETIDVAIMIAIGETVMAGQSDIEPERNSIHTIVAVKRDSNWCFTAFQNSRVQYIGRPEESRALTEELQQELSKISKENMVD